MSKRKPTNLSSFFNSDEFTQELIKVDEIEGMNITILDMELRKGQFGEYCLFNIVIEETGQEGKAQSGSMPIMHMLKKAEADRHFPFRCKIVKFNRMWKPVDADDMTE